MATEIISGPLGELRAASTANGGTALTTTATYIQLPQGPHPLFITPRNFVTAVVAQIFLNPWLIVLRTADNLATVQDFSVAAQDADAATDVVLSSMDTAANGDYLYVGAYVPFAGVSIDVDSANGTASVLTVNYWNGAWTDTSATDNTASGGATLAVDGTVTWTVPADWRAASLQDIDSPPPSAAISYKDERLYWTRWQISAALDSSTTLNSLVATNRSTAYFEMMAGQNLEARVRSGIGGTGCIQAKVDAGTGNLIVNISSSASGSFS